MGHIDTGTPYNRNKLLSGTFIGCDLLIHLRVANIYTTRFDACLMGLLWPNASDVVCGGANVCPAESSTVDQMPLLVQIA